MTSPNPTRPWLRAALLSALAAAAHPLAAQRDVVLALVNGTGRILLIKGDNDEGNQRRDVLDHVLVRRARDGVIERDFMHLPSASRQELERVIHPGSLVFLGVRSTDGTTQSRTFFLQAGIPSGTPAKPMDLGGLVFTACIPADTTRPATGSLALKALGTLADHFELRPLEPLLIREEPDLEIRAEAWVLAPKAAPGTAGETGASAALPEPGGGAR